MGAERSNQHDQDVAQSLKSDDDTLIEDTNPRENDVVVIEDWSKTGRGSHVEFKDDEHVPFEQGMFLGRGAVGDVHEVVIQGNKVAHKRMVVKRKLDGKEKKEIEILKRLSSHEHMIQLLGTYTHRQFLGILLYPVATCDLHTFFEDVEAWHNTGLQSNNLEARQQMLDVSQKGRLTALGYQFSTSSDIDHALPVYGKVGCLVSAISYLHDRKIRHKDLKPSNILLSKNRLWLSDFGSATDFSMLSQSATDNDRGTPRYFSPEVAAWQPNGRASDIFSLGCVMLEILVLHGQGTLAYIRQNRAADPAFHANIKNIANWLKGPIARQWPLHQWQLMQEVRSMLSHDPLKRPSAKELLLRITGYDLANMVHSQSSVFGDCCKAIFLPLKTHNEQITRYQHETRKRDEDLTLREKECVKMEGQAIEHKHAYEELKAQYEWRELHTESLEAEVKKLSFDLEKSRQETEGMIRELAIEEYKKREELEQLEFKYHGHKSRFRAREKEFKTREEAWKEEKSILSQRIAELEAQNESKSSETTLLALPGSAKERKPLRQHIAELQAQNGSKSSETTLLALPGSAKERKPLRQRIADVERQRSSPKPLSPLPASPKQLSTLPQSISEVEGDYRSAESGQAPLLPLPVSERVISESTESLKPSLNPRNSGEGSTGLAAKERSQSIDATPRDPIIWHTANYTGPLRRGPNLANDRYHNTVQGPRYNDREAVLPTKPMPPIPSSEAKAEFRSRVRKATADHVSNSNISTQREGSQQPSSSKKTEVVGRPQKSVEKLPFLRDEGFLERVKRKLAS